MLTRNLPYGSTSLHSFSHRIAALQTQLIKYQMGGARPQMVRAPPIQLSTIVNGCGLIINFRTLDSSDEEAQQAHQRCKTTCVTFNTTFSCTCMYTEFFTSHSLQITAQLDNTAYKTSSSQPLVQSLVRHIYNGTSINRIHSTHN